MAPIVFTAEDAERPKAAAGAVKADNRKVRRHKIKRLDRIQISKYRASNWAKDATHNSGLEDFSMKIETCKQYLSSRVNKGDLWNITLRTLNLMQRNRLLQQQLEELQQETKEFLAAVMGNPENKGRKECDISTQ